MEQAILHVLMPDDLLTAGLALMRIGQRMLVGCTGDTTLGLQVDD